MLHDNREVRKIYSEKVRNIPNLLDENCLQELAIQAFELRNACRTETRNLMKDQDARTILEMAMPNKTFDELLGHKIHDKHLTYKESLYDIIKSATTTNKEVDDRLKEE